MSTLQHLHQIYTQYVKLAYLTDVLYHNFANEKLEENNIDILIKDSILVAWSAFARSLLDCLLTENKSENENRKDDLIAIDFFNSQLVNEYLATQNKLKSCFEVTEFKKSIHKYSLHLTYFNNPEIEEYRRKVFEYFDFIHYAMNNFLIYLKRVEEFEPIMNKYPLIVLEFSTTTPDFKMKISGEVRGITLLSNLRLFDALNDMKF
ncbi:MAG: hypothetical protein JNL36_01075 [Candidatus Kapabacteria bacterium]|nr:hypothetical protein [Candidatus Kapabacteria bacterium]